VVAQRAENARPTYGVHSGAAVPITSRGARRSVGAGSSSTPSTTSTRPLSPPHDPSGGIAPERLGIAQVTYRDGIRPPARPSAGASEQRQFAVNRDRLKEPAALVPQHDQPPQSGKLGHGRPANLADHAAVLGES
jgi:hypothetical protein